MTNEYARIGLIKRQTRILQDQLDVDASIVREMQRLQIDRELERFQRDSGIKPRQWTGWALTPDQIKAVLQKIKQICGRKSAAELRRELEGLQDIGQAAKRLPDKKPP